MNVSIPSLYEVTITTDQNDGIFEFNAGGHFAAEQNNATRVTFAATVDLAIENVRITPAVPVPGDTLTITWDTINRGNLAANAPFHDRVQVTRLASIPLSLSRIPISDVNVAHPATPLGPGESRSTSVQVVLPAGSSGVGDIEVLITADRNNSVVEYTTLGTAESNIETSTTTT